MIPAQHANLQGLQFRCFLTNDESNTCHSCIGECDSCCVLHPDEGKKASFQSSRQLQEDVKVCQSPSYLCLQAIPSSSTDSSLQDINIQPFVLGGFELISNSRVVEVYVSEVKDSPSTSDTYVTTCRGISWKDENDATSSFFKIVMVLPGGPRKLTRFRIKVLSKQPSEEIKTIIRSFSIKGRIIVDTETSGPPLSIAQSISNHESSQSQNFPTFSSPGMIDVTAAAFAGMTGVVKATEERLIKTIDSHQKYITNHLQRVEAALGMQGSALQQLQIMIFQQNELILKQQMQLQEDLNDQRSLLKAIISNLESKQLGVPQTETVQGTESITCDQATLQVEETECFHSERISPIIEDEDSKPPSKMPRCVDQLGNTLDVQNDETIRRAHDDDDTSIEERNLSTAISREINSTLLVSETCKESPALPNEFNHYEDTSNTQLSEVNHESTSCKEAWNESKGNLNDNPFQEDEDCKPASRSRSTEDLKNAIPGYFTSKEDNLEGCRSRSFNSLPGVSISSDTSTYAAVMPTSATMEDACYKSRPLDGEEKKNDDDISSPSLPIISDEEKPSECGWQEVLKVSAQSILEPPDKGWGSPNSMLPHTEEDKAGEVINLIDLS
jgi:hypothetical protein